MSETFSAPTTTPPTNAKWGQQSNHLISAMKTVASKPAASVPTASEDGVWVRNQKVPPAPPPPNGKKKGKGVMLFSTARY